MNGPLVVGIGVGGGNHFVFLYFLLKRFLWTVMRQPYVQNKAAKIK